MKDKNDPKMISNEAKTLRLNSCGWYLGILGERINTEMIETLKHYKFNVINDMFVDSRKYTPPGKGIFNFLKK